LVTCAELNIYVDLLFWWSTDGFLEYRLTSMAVRVKGPSPPKPVVAFLLKFWCYEKLKSSVVILHSRYVHRQTLCPTALCNSHREFYCMDWMKPVLVNPLVLCIVPLIWGRKRLDHVVMTTRFSVVSIGFTGLYVSISEFPFSHVLVQTAAWNLIKIAHNVYLISLSRWTNPLSFSTNFRANIAFGSNISPRSLNSIIRIIIIHASHCSVTWSRDHHCGHCDDHAGKTGIILTFLDVPWCNRLKTWQIGL
jgi:hypothetical protein